MLFKEEALKFNINKVMSLSGLNFPFLRCSS